MGIIQERDPVKLVTSIFSRDKNLIDSVIKMLVDKFGKIDFETELLDFNQTDYYEKEMGKTLLRKFVSFEGLIEPNSISNIKIYTNNKTGGTTNIKHHYIIRMRSRQNVRKFRFNSTRLFISP